MFAGTAGFLEAQILYKNKISDLEAKLAELEQENRELHTSINLSIPNQIAMKDEIERLHTCIDKRISELVDENDNLKQQLAEKESHYEIIMPSRQNGKTTLHRIKLVEWQNKKAIAELEKVKDKIKKLPCAMTLTTSAFEQIYKVDATRQIDNQIAW